MTRTKILWGACAIAMLLVVAIVENPWLTMCAIVTIGVVFLLGALYEIEKREKASYRKAEAELNESTRYDKKVA